MLKLIKSVAHCATTIWLTTLILNTLHAAALNQMFGVDTYDYVLEALNQFYLPKVALCYLLVFVPIHLMSKEKRSVGLVLSALIGLWVAVAPKELAAYNSMYLLITALVTCAIVIVTRKKGGPDAGHTNN